MGGRVARPFNIVRRRGDGKSSQGVRLRYRSQRRGLTGDSRCDVRPHMRIIARHLGDSGAIKVTLLEQGKVPEIPYVERSTLFLVHIITLQYRHSAMLTLGNKHSK